MLKKKIHEELPPTAFIGAIIFRAKGNSNNPPLVIDTPAYHLLDGWSEQDCLQNLVSRIYIELGYRSAHTCSYWAV